MSQTIFERTRIEGSICALCGEGEETGIHLFKYCKVTKLLAFASNWGCCLDAWNIENITKLVRFCIDPPRGACGPGFSNVSVTIYLSCLFYFT